MTNPAAPIVKDTRPPFLRLSARMGWRLAGPETRPGLPFVDRPLTLAIAGRSAIPLAEPFGSFGGGTLPKGVAIAPDGRMFVADPQRRVILTLRAGEIPDNRPAKAEALWPFAPLWPARDLPVAQTTDALCDLGPVTAPDDPYVLVEPVGVAVSPSGDLAILDRGAGRVLVLAWPSSRIRQVLPLKEGRAEALLYDRAGRLYVVLSAPGKLLRWDRQYRPDPGFPRAPLRQPVALALAAASGCGCAGGSGRGSGCGGADEDCTCAGGGQGCPAPGKGGCAGGCRPIDPPGAHLYVLDSGLVVALDEAGFVVKPVSPDLSFVMPPLRRGAEDALLWSGPGAAAQQPFRFQQLTLDLTGRHSGSGLPLLALPRRIEVPRSGGFTTTALDSGQSGFHWDRLGFDLDLPANARLIVSTLTSDVEVPPDRIAAVPEDRWSRALALLPGDLPEMMVQSGPGRFLWLRAELSGDGTSAPLIRGIDIYAPRQSSIRYLPAPFREDPESARFLDRFLGYFDTVFAEVTARHRSLAELFDPRVTPSEFLAWFGAWFDLSFLASWPESTRREMIAGAIAQFRQRGTVQGLRQILQWHTGLTGHLPQVIEHFRLPSGGIALGGTRLDPGTLAHGFTVVLPAHLAASDADRAVLERLIAASIPAHTSFQLSLIEPGVLVGHQSRIGVDMILGPVGPGALGAGRLGLTLSTADLPPQALIHLPHPLPMTKAPPADLCEGVSPC